MLSSLELGLPHLIPLSLPYCLVHLYSPSYPFMSMMACSCVTLFHYIRGSSLNFRKRLKLSTWDLLRCILATVSYKIALVARYGCPNGPIASSCFALGICLIAHLLPLP